MSFRFCADGVAVLGTVRILAAQSKRRSSAGACVDGNWTQLSPASRSRPCKIEIQGQKSLAGFKQPDFIERREAVAKARKLALEKFRAKAADPALAERLTARAARAAEARSSRRQSGVAVCATGALTARLDHEAPIICSTAPELIDVSDRPVGRCTIVRQSKVAKSHFGDRYSNCCDALCRLLAMVFKVGDVVRLKSGGALMTVFKFFKSPEGREMVQCTWFDKPRAPGRICD